MMGTATASTVSLRPHRFLARTFSAARWSEYDMLLSTALDEGWTPIDFERWIAAGGVQGRVLILRHDVDQHPRTAVRMGRIEAGHGITSTWYFRWRTAAPRAIERIRAIGGGVGLHYETLTRLVLERGLTADEVTPELIEEAREELRHEVAAFKNRFGPLQSICAHGDTRVPGVSNQVLTRGVDPWEFGVSFEAYDAISHHHLGVWMTDRTSADGRWKDGVDPLEVLRETHDPVLCLTHPNNWCSGLSLWSDRARAAAFDRPLGVPVRLGGSMRTGDDRPPSQRRALSSHRVVAKPELRSAPPVRSFAPIAMTLRREIVRHYYDIDKPLASAGGLRTLDTNSSLAESRAATLEHALGRADVATVRDLDVLDLGCGFGALALVFASRGARVYALDPNGRRLDVGRTIAEEYGLPVRWSIGGMDTTDLGCEEFDVAVMNNSFCYLTDRAQRMEALQRTWQALRPGGVLVQREPKRIRIRDQFTGLPLLSMLPPGPAGAISRALRLGRSDVRLLTGRAAKAELRRAGFVDVAIAPATGNGWLSEALSGYHHLVARRPLR